MQVLLDQVALPLDPGLHLRRHVRDQPRHKELHCEDHVLGGGKGGGGAEGQYSLRVERFITHCAHDTLAINTSRTNWSYVSLLPDDK